MENEKKLVVWILQTGEPLHTDKNFLRPMRAINLSNKFIEKGHKVVLWSSRFDHQSKKHRKNSEHELKVNESLEIRLISSCGYKKNISIRRLIDHFQLGFNLAKMLRKEKQLPDIAFLGFPPIEVNLVMSNWLRKKKIPFIVDVKDLWPDVFIENLIGLKKKIAKLLLFYYYSATKKIYRHAEAITSITSKFLEHIENFSNRDSNKRNKVFPLVSNLNLDDKNYSSDESWWDSLGVYNDNTFRVVFVGNLSSYLNLLDIKKAAQSFKEKKVKVQFVISGNGDYLEIFKNMMKGLDNVVFSGTINKSKVFALAKRSNIWLIPYFNKKSFILSLPNKTYDALFFGIPIFSPLKGEVRDLILKNKIGMFYDKNNSLEKCIIKLKNNDDLQKSMSVNAKKLYDENFEFDKVYDGLIYHLENIAKNKK